VRCCSFFPSSSFTRREKKRNNQKKSYTTFHGKLVFRVFRFFGWGVGSVEGLVVVVLMSGLTLSFSWFFH
jgi:hypothetical protein